MDLSYTVAAELGRGRRQHDERANLLADDSLRVWAFLSARSAGRVAILADNAGSELLADLALADPLSAAGRSAVRIGADGAGDRQRRRQLQAPLG